MFITFEGCEGAGKTSQMDLVERYLTARDIRCALTREPGNGKLGRQIRDILLNPNNKEMTPMTEALLFMADRCQHLETFVFPNLKDRKVVISDRFFDSTLAYQGVARGLGLKTVTELHNIVFLGIKPSLTFLLDISAETSMRRVEEQLRLKKRDRKESRFEDEDLGFHQKVREGFLEAASQDPERIFVVNAELPKDEVWGEIQKKLKEFFGP